MMHVILIAGRLVVYGGMKLSTQLSQEQNLTTKFVPYFHSTVFLLTLSNFPSHLFTRSSSIHHKIVCWQYAKMQDYKASLIVTNFSAPSRRGKLSA